jgi:hypothetical protein
MRPQRWTGTRWGIALGLALIFGLTLAGAVRAQAPSLGKQAELTLNRYGRFGRAVALSADGRTALVAADVSPDCPGPRGCTIGYVYVLRSGAWSLEGTLDLPAIEGNDFYGPAVSLSEDGDIALVGLPNYDCGPLQRDCGAAFLFVRSGEAWGLRQEIRAADAAESNRFGDSVSLSGDGSVALVGAPWRSCAQELCGAVYVFSQTGSLWHQTARMTASDGGFQEYFGKAVSLSRDGATALIGAQGDQRNDGQCEAPFRCGAAYVFTAQGNAWHEDQKLVASNAQINDSFGFSVSLSGDGSTAAIGNMGIAGSNAYVFTRTGGVWAERQILPHLPSPYFGFSVGLSHSGDTLLVGEITGGQFCSPNICRPAHLFQKQGATWAEIQTFHGSDPQEGNSLFGHAVGISGSGRTVIVGSSAQFCSGGPHDGRAECGAAYIFSALSIAEVPAVSPLGLAMLALLLAASGLYAVARR